ncbi:hypothetical protein Csa_009231 [Cucumis sativus]|uniref:Uncharacterized protein n=1 Tax=Cucumis sativus TaxID=3659 RepID=A0A0A0L672_CUCSA|nr:hypothetical protein Csa_009231 [Cucumis sativus]
MLGMLKYPDGKETCQTINVLAWDYTKQKGLEKLLAYSKEHFEWNEFEGVNALTESQGKLKSLNLNES